jgi:glycine cleavage system H lipoate-binding protein/TusA-related sulfurtransferase
MVSVNCSLEQAFRNLESPPPLARPLRDRAQSPVETLSFGFPMKIDGCEFPDDLLYDREGLVWIRPSPTGDAVVGITSIYAALAGRVAKVTTKTTGTLYPRGAAIGFLESGKHFGPIRTPVGGVLLEVNPSVLAKPRLLTEALYHDGWVARMRPSALTRDRPELLALPAGRETLEKQIAALRVRCFAAFPDYEMFEIGVECAAVLVKLNELLSQIPVGDVVHVVTDDPTSPIEMVRWSDETGQPVIDERKEGSLFHFLVRKVS